MVSSTYFIVLFLAITFTSNVWSQQIPPETRIVGGIPVQRDALRQQASIRYKSSDSTFGNGHVCGGNLISNNTVLSAAHCFVDDLGRRISVSDIRVVGGNLLLTEQTQNTFTSDVARLIIHPGYNRNTYADDIAILIVRIERKSTLFCHLLQTFFAQKKKVFNNFFWDEFSSRQLYQRVTQASVPSHSVQFPWIAIQRAKSPVGVIHQKMVRDQIPFSRPMFPSLTSMYATMHTEIP
uniref:Putative serine protease n=1 Tax=Lutzomyia longipalpis TaxID=7200 RepID=A0A7G3B0J5_LUTLO